ncbi:cyclase family protein [Pseudonocardia bannensis]|uniref:Cyclase family protein n=1 Tax=Pseudonocardia bannensis TaxID=630973 RepID=A0A848DN00_9PSEU|nr:cyclase family protein [Pseudonocardia bannensis]NMH94157.1 cyclase family protein [Pseudonocardia bannensis]
MDADEVITLPGGPVRPVDLSHPLGPTPSEPAPPHIARTSHADGAELWDHWYGIPAGALPLGAGFAGEVVTASTHAGTHVDAPWHYAATAEGAPAWTVDEVPLSWFIGPLVILDVTDLATGELVTPPLIDTRLAALDHRLAPGDVVAFRTGADRLWGREEFWEHGAGLGRDAVLHLVDAGVRLIGTDAWSLDRPYPRIGEEWRGTRDPERLWPAHFAGADRRYCQVEKLTRLDEVPPTGATIVCLPIKVAAGSGAWVRATALVPA